MSLTRLLLTASAYRQSATLATAVELNVFSVLSEGPKTAQEVARALGISVRSADKLLGGLVGFGLLEKRASVYRNTNASETYLVPGSELYLGDGILFLKSIGEKTWSTLTDALKTGGPVGHQRTGEPDAEFWRKLTKAIRPLSLPVAESVCQVIKSADLKNPVLLDLAGGSGVFAHRFLQAFPDGQAIQFDWPGVNTVATQFAEQLGVASRFKTENGNLLDGDWVKRSYDVVVLSHFLHQEGKETALKLLKRIKGCLKEDGFLIINEFCLNPEKTGPTYGLMFALSMMLQNTDGDSYSFSEYMEWMEEAGIIPELVYSPLPPSTVIVGRSRNGKKKSTQPVSAGSVQFKKNKKKSCSPLVISTHQSICEIKA